MSENRRYSPNKQQQSPHRQSVHHKQSSPHGRQYGTSPQKHDHVREHREARRDMMKKRLDSFPEDLKTKYKNKLSVLWPWESSHWSTIEKKLNSKITTARQLEDDLHEIAGPKASSMDFTFFRQYFGKNKEKSEKFFGQTLPFIQQLALRLPGFFVDKELPLLVPGKPGSVKLSREEAASILANGFLGTFIFQDPVAFTGFQFPDVNFWWLYKELYFTAQLEHILHYFERIRESMPTGYVIFERRTMEEPPNWHSSSKKILPLVVFNDGTIEDSDAILHADFANEFIGGGAVYGGNVQEEILFMLKPECLVGMLFCAKMEPNEALFVTGAERFSSYKGYGKTWEFGGNYVDKTPSVDGVINRTLVVYDAIKLTENKLGQFGEEMFFRDLNKAYCAFLGPPSNPQMDQAVATGNWGCGAFGGDKMLKFIQQILAASEAERNITYYTFGDIELQENINRFSNMLSEHSFTVGELCTLYTANCEKYPHQKRNLFAFLATMFSRQAKADQEKH